MELSVKDKVEKLEEAKKILKKEFIGLDEIIDKIISSITPWYITKDVLERPTVISLWGMTGTGKTSVIRRLISLLELNEKAVFFDCGRESESEGYSDRLSDKILNLMGDMDENVSSVNTTQDFVFIFDEFQYARTLDEALNELTKPSLRPIWNIIDDGFIPVYESRYSLNLFMDFLEDALLFEKENPDVTIHFENGKVVDPEEIKVLSKSQLGMFHLGGSCVMELCSSEEECSSEGEDENKEKTYNLAKIFSNHLCKNIYKKLNLKQEGLGTTIVNKIKNVKTLSELLRILEDIRKDILAPKILNCSKSLVFVIGNLDEAFKVQGDLDHDGDADTFREITNNVSVTEIKQALKRRFRAEQISRLGNNLIKYPTLNKKHFEEIIEKELSRINAEFKNKTGISVVYESGIKELLYSEGVCPVQGVRPVFTTINMIITPLLSNILIKSVELGSTDATICLADIDDWKIRGFRIPEISLIIKYNKDNTILLEETKEIKLQVGELRSPNNRKTRFACGIHEAGHAISMLSCTGEYPIQVIAVDTNNGGCCYSYQKDRHGEISTRRDIENSIQIGLGGYIAEQLVFKDKSLCLLGSGSDLAECWETLSNAILVDGYLEPVLFSDPNILLNSTGIPTGIDIKSSKVFYDGINMTVEASIRYIMDRLETNVSSLLRREIKLLAEMGKYLGNNGSMNKTTMLEFVDKFGTSNLKQEIEDSKRDMSYDRYYECIMDILE